MISDLFNYSFLSNNIKKFYNIGIFIQSIISIIILIFSIIYLFPGSLNANYRVEVLKKAAYSYDLYYQIKNLLPLNAKLLTKYGFTFSDRKTYSLE